MYLNFSDCNIESFKDTCTFLTIEALCSFYCFQITISDNGTPPLSSTTRVVVVVDDVNDNIPQFEENFYHVVIPETRDSNTPSAQVKLDLIQLYCSITVIILALFSVCWAGFVVLIMFYVFQNEVDSGEELGFEALLSNDSWESLDVKNISGTPLFRVTLHDMFGLLFRSLFVYF